MQISHLGGCGLNLFLCDTEIPLLFGERGSVLCGLRGGAGRSRDGHLRRDDLSGIVGDLGVMEAQPHECGGQNDQRADHFPAEARDTERGHVTPF